MGKKYTKFEFYDQKLSHINDIRFTYREMDVLACLVNKLEEEEISLLLSIASQTIKTYIRNIRIKIGNNSRISILRFVEKSQYLLLIIEYYKYINIEASFQKQLLNIGTKINPELISIKLSHGGLSKTEQNKLKILNDHLKLSNIILENLPHPDTNAPPNTRHPNISHSNTNHPEICHESVSVLGSSLPSRSLQDIIIMLESTDLDFDKNEIIDLENNYYESVFILIEKILKSPKIQDFFDKHVKNSKKLSFKRASKSPWNKLYLIVIFSVLLAAILAYNNLIFSFKTKTVIKSNLFLSQVDSKLYRSGMTSLIKNKFAESSDIQKVVLAGIGGAGKTTLARQYAKNSNARIIWEIEAITKEKTFLSLQQLASELCENNIESQDLKAILSRGNATSRYGKFMSFLTQKLKTHSNWLLIYDNVKNFQHIKKFFPYDHNVWGTGKVIITTRNSNISSNIFIPDDNIIYVGELNPKDKRTLFDNIIGDLGMMTEKEKIKINDFLAQVPSFPLDVSLAAYYIKETNISHERYLNQLLKRDKKFVLKQEKLLSEIGEYSNTRFDIVAICTKQLIKNNPNFQELLFLISLIDPQTISREILLDFKSNIIVDRFFHFLKKFSLITKRTLSIHNQNIDSISLHRSSGRIILSFLKSFMNEAEKQAVYNQVNQSIAKYMLKVIDQCDITKIKLIIRHAESFIRNTKENPIDIKMGNLLSECYMIVGEYKKSKQLLHEIISVNNLQDIPNSENLAETISHLGNVYRAMGKYQEAQEHLEESSKLLAQTYGLKNIITRKALINLSYTYRDLGKYHKAKNILKDMLNVSKELKNIAPIELANIKAELADIYKKLGMYDIALKYYQKAIATLKNHYGNNTTKIAWIYVQLGALYRNMGLYKKSKDLVDQGSRFFIDNYGKHSVKIAWILIQKGNIYQDIGNTKNITELFKRAHRIYQDYYGENHIKLGWASCYLGRAYSKFGLHKESISFLKQAVKIHKMHYGLDHVKTAWAQSHLINSYIKNGNLTEAQHLLEQVNKIYKDFYGATHVKYAHILLAKGQISFAKGHLELAEMMYNDALDIYNNSSHAGRYKCFEALGDLYLFRAQNNVSGNINISNILYKKAKYYFTESLDILLKDFPKDSPHVTRIQSKI
ncbi:MAG: hypothetical protein COA94_08985 [Rickettsiales bacterium]|nr:MAG: hypothetical protein COA94_08985 [Rickettsiales bacterium]